MMSAITGGRMPATTHRVINPEGESDGGRLFMPFFMHPRPDAVFKVLVEGDQAQIEGVGMTAQAFLDRRLSENGLITPPQV
jgi:isopenicillin N synthase-like dioxygenase